MGGLEMRSGCFFEVGWPKKRWITEVRMLSLWWALLKKTDFACGPLKRFALRRTEDGSGKGHPRRINYPDPACLQCGTPRDPGTQSRLLGIVGDPGATPSKTFHCGRAARGRHPISALTSTNRSIVATLWLSSWCCVCLLQEYWEQIAMH